MLTMENPDAEEPEAARQWADDRNSANMMGDAMSVFPSPPRRLQMARARNVFRRRREFPTVGPIFGKRRFRLSLRFKWGA